MTAEDDYGHNYPQTSIAPSTAPATVTNGNDEVYIWTDIQALVTIHNQKDSATDLYVVWNGTAASKTAFDFVIEPGQTLSNPDGIGVIKVAIYSDGDDATYGTDFTADGWGK